MYKNINQFTNINFKDLINNLSNQEIIEFLEFLKINVEQKFKKKIDVLLEFDRKNIYLILLIKEENMYNNKFLKSNLEINDNMSLLKIYDSLKNNLIKFKISNTNIKIEKIQNNGTILYKKHPDILNFLKLKIKKFLEK